MIRRSHHFFFLNSNSFSLLSSISFFNILCSFCWFIKFGELKLFCFILTTLILVGFLWWSCYSQEFNRRGFGSFDLESGLKFGIIMFILSEVFFFLSFFWSYFNFFLSPFIERGFNWPPYLIEIFHFDALPIVNTIVLLSSGVRVTVSHYFLVTRKKSQSEFFLFATILLGSIFTIFQLIEYSNSFFSINDGNFGRVFFVLTGFHGIHVILGNLFLFYVLLKFKSYNRKLRSFLSFELSSWYWHFVDVIWLFLFYLIYYINRF